MDSQTLNFNACKITDNIAHKKPLKGLFLDGMLITGEGQTVNFRPEVDNGCQATSECHTAPHTVTQKSDSMFGTF